MTPFTLPNRRVHCHARDHRAHVWLGVPDRGPVVPLPSEWKGQWAPQRPRHRCGSRDERARRRSILTVLASIPSLFLCSLLSCLGADHCLVRGDSHALARRVQAGNASTSCTPRFGDAVILFFRGIYRLNGFKRIILCRPSRQAGPPSSRKGAIFKSPRRSSPCWQIGSNREGTGVPVGVGSTSSTGTAAKI